MPDDAPSLKPTLGLLSATLLIVGSSIGSGIFRLPSTMAAQVGSPWLLIGVWVLCGVLSLTGALTFAEMGGMFPRAGGQYVFLKQALGGRVAFLYGWTFFWVIQTGIIAAVATAFAGFLAVLLPLSAFQQKLVAMGVIGLLSLVNYVGVKYGGAVSNVFTTLKVAALAALVLLGFALARGAGNYAMAPIPQTAGLVGSIGLAMSAAFFAYDGWNQSAAVASEIKEPQRNVPLSMLFGVLGVMVVYVLANLAYVYVLPFHDIVATQTLASDVARVLLGPVGATLITIAVLVSTFGTVNAYVLSGPRVYYAMAKDGLSYPGLASVSKRFATPDFAILVQAEWAMLLVLTGSYNSLVNFSVFAILLFYGIATIGFFLLRRREPHTPRPYRTVLYPVVPLVFLATCVFVVVNTLVSDFWDAFWGLVLILTGVPALFLVEWANRRRTQADGEVAPA
ncbi:MAG: basic amino acid/polyamine antiporter, family [Thermoplasmata archaeon]|nr:basic amino acid/polyamine antiporter, family [Thermoplasmata archaeon]